MTSEASDEKQALLDEINKNVPQGVDWKRGAIRYLGELIDTQGVHAERYHLIKPFVGGPDFSPFYADMHKLLNLLERLGLPMKSSFLDVACGPGWVSHYIGKLGHTVLGIDISEELIEIARRRIESDPFPAYPEAPYHVEFMVHDIERGPLAAGSLFDAAILESCLHHFYDPISALENVSPSLKPDGVIAILEGTAPEPGSQYEKDNLKIMREYHTLERPYTREQMARMLRLTGFTHFEFYYPIDGFFARTPEVADAMRERILLGHEWNIVVASRSADRMRRLSDTFVESAGAEPRVEFIRGFYAEEQAGDGSGFRWSKVESTVRLSNAAEAEVRISSHLPSIARREQKVFIYIEGRLERTVTLSSDRESASARLCCHSDNATIEFASDSVFSPLWFGEKDSRMLSFMVQIVSLK